MKPEIKDKSLRDIVVLTRKILDIAREGGMSLEEAKDIRGAVWKNVANLTEERRKQLIEEKLISL